MIMKRIIPLGLFLLGACVEEELPPQEVFPYYRTVLVYMGGDNNLSAETDAKVGALSSGWDYLGCRLIIYQDKGGTPCLHEVTSQGVRTVKTYPDENSASGETLRRTVRDMMELYPSDSYGLVVFSHGTGWLPQGMYPVSRSIIADGKSEMEIADFAGALSDCHFDFIIFEACFMAAVEVAWELRERTDYIVASAAEMLSPGFTDIYAGLRKYLFFRYADLPGFARMYYEHYNGLTGVDRSATISVIRTSEMQGLADALRPVLTNSKEVAPRQVEFYDRSSGLTYLYSDLADYLRLKADTPEQYAVAMRAMERTVVYRAATPYMLGRELKAHSGLSVYIPRASYPQLNAYYSETGWYDIIN